MKIIPIILILFLILSCVDDSEPISTVNVSITQELFGNAAIGVRMVTWADLANPEEVPEYFSNLPTTTERERTLTATTHGGEPFLLLLENKQRYSRLRIDVDRTGQRAFSLLSIPEVSDKLHIFVFNNGDKQRTEQLEQIIREATECLQGYVIRKANY